MIFQLALKNLWAGRLRTWLNLLVLSLTLGTMIFIQALMEGTLEQMLKARMAEEVGGGQLWFGPYDPLDPLSLEKANGPLPPEVALAVDRGEATVVLALFGTAYPQGRMTSVVLKGINPNQSVLALSFAPLAQAPPSVALPVMVGERMAKQLSLAVGDRFTLLWRAQAGAFDALEVQLVGLFSTQVPSMDQGQLWFRLEDLQRMNGTAGQASLVVFRHHPPASQGVWTAKSPETLMQDSIEMMATKSAGNRLFYLLLLMLSLLAVFDSQALAVFRRRKEVGTLMALGFSNQKILALFLAEGMGLGLLASLLTLAWGWPLAGYLVREGLDFGVSGDSYGMALSSRFYPAFSAQMVLESFGIVNLLVSLVSFLPLRKITGLSPADAIRGNWL
ncbi:MAG: hypothetical protein A2600_08660 [Candidatus Lambdaproteobacteria bacterium RIFOXYD1_FULL_56_27]|uniref:ABC3 transporter permease C-terminal domain-containing protein n=1 Tax=Candidatus Lambdaproteobacteria bacterium RIFOXYD2_FULL_56_26 TaxID=1817773 RepID=A0A1F6GYZ9_9PROT|nr:MAG: hypothetical protein A2426_10080 [Candidatus Lambdaproteobacteria bacterium RIFOXYC1_FULL_56_13]OGH03393.1 MAG: hypothetical protein A2557_02605 [Candidatus Lambdaproteobacteria bacterium RIFOXYD2_FULL_56_26]OGH06602.1 MAG: hypothetical protein A2600_08660 [Candidatus Lambdaproteobacteria bacterium RIFOXYD1_FULL_56_27]